MPNTSAPAASAKPEPVQVEAVLVPAAAPKKKPGRKPVVIETTITREQADIIHARIHQGIASAATNLAGELVKIAKDLRVIRQTNAWSYYADDWTTYLVNHREFSRSYMFSLAKLGQVDDLSLDRFLELGIGATQLVEYARLAPGADQIKPLVDQTWSAVKALKVKDLSKELKKSAAELKPTKGNPAGKPRGRHARSWLEKFEILYAEIPSDQQHEFDKAVRQFLKQQTNAPKAT